MTTRAPSLQARHNAFYANPSADCVSTDVLQMRKTQLLGTDPQLLEIQRVLDRRKSQVQLERTR